MKEIITNNLGDIVAFVFTLVFTFILAYIVRRGFDRLLKELNSQEGIDATNYSFLRYIAVAIVYIIGFMMAIYAVPALRTIGSTLLAGAGVLALALSFASQQALSNVISGLFIVIFKPFRIKDRLHLVTKGGIEGVVEDITLRHTVIRNLENRRIIVPNSVISDEVIINSDYGDGFICKKIEVGISYESSIDKARAIIQEEAIKHPLQIDRRTALELENGDPEVVVRVANLGESSVDLRVWVWAKNQKEATIMLCELLETIKKRFDKDGISIPYPHRTITNK